MDLILGPQGSSPNLEAIDLNKTKEGEKGKKTRNMPDKKQQQKGTASADRKAACAQTFQGSNHCKPTSPVGAARCRALTMLAVEEETVGLNTPQSGRCQRQCVKPGFLFFFISVRTLFHFQTQKHTLYMYIIDSFMLF